jgi:hypothetical protein
MISINIRSILTTIVIGFFAILGTSQLANAQGKSRNDDRRENKKDNKRGKSQKKADSRAERQRDLYERQREARWTERNRQILRSRSGNDRSNGQGYYNGNANDRANRSDRYRVYRNGSYYNTNRRGADLLRQAVNQGYQQGFQAGRSDRNNRRNNSWTNSNVYRSGNYGYQSYVTQSQYRYYFQQGFQRGYQDGSNSRYQDDYNGQYEYGYYNNGSPSILETILNSVLRIQNY